MKKARHSVFLLLSIFLLSSAFHASAQVVDISGCRAIEDRLQRFDCYENLEPADAAPPQPQANRTAPPVPAESVGRAPAVAPAVREQPASVAPTADQTVDTFGTRPETARATSARVAKDEDGRTELLDTIATLEQRGPNLWLITLQSGQKWAQMLSKRYPVNAGDQVRIYPSRFGQAYRLTAPRLSGFIQVERVD